MYLGENEISIKEQSPLSLAFVGDGVFELLVRQRLVQTTRLQPGALHKMAVKLVSAKGQYTILKKLVPYLTDVEQDIIRRGKNASKASVAKNATPEEYRASTALETLFGYLYLQEQNNRISALFDIAWAAVENI